MIRFQLQPEPATFDAEVRQPGQAWLARCPEAGSRPPPHWNRVRIQLCDAFSGLCAYSAMQLPSHGGHVDHFVSAGEDRNRLYDWTNYRFAAGSINSSKKDLRSSQLLDPFDVEDDWFELLLPSLELRVTAACPEPYRERARFMLKRLGLGDGRQVLHTRHSWMEQFKAGLPLPSLERNAPLLARAVEKRLVIIEQRGPAQRPLLDGLRRGALSFPQLRRENEPLALEIVGQVGHVVIP